MDYVIIIVGTLLVGFAIRTGIELKVNPFAPVNLAMFHDDLEEEQDAVKPAEQHLNEAVSRVFNRI